LDEQNQRQEKLQVPQRIKNLYSSAEVIKAFHLCWHDPKDEFGLKTLKEAVEKIRRWAPESKKGSARSLSHHLTQTFFHISDCSSPGETDMSSFTMT
jgi:hypothetical protein